ncbi:hypothetical protein CEXT_525831 [Caerostris extrusa]|uniref:Uncharacterized protein n=1 Tax=Caerostris extrusa TaxID=172846 RepID=A0AAV4PJB8_CAEEX|nr:hypothetical protein CEXT_525831 [Caerostris extrusa]
MERAPCERFLHFPLPLLPADATPSVGGRWRQQQKKQWLPSNRIFPPLLFFRRVCALSLPCGRTEVTVECRMASGQNGTLMFHTRTSPCQPTDFKY